MRGSLPSARAETMRAPEKLRSTNWDHTMRVAGFSLADAGEDGAQTAGMMASAVAAALAVTRTLMLIGTTLSACLLSHLRA